MALHDEVKERSKEKMPGHDGSDPEQTTPPTLANLATRSHGAESIFSANPCIGSEALKSGAVCAVPYHNYDSDATIIWGSAEKAWVALICDNTDDNFVGKVLSSKH